MFQWKEAEAKFTEAIAINPNYTKAFFKRALTRYELADYEGSYVDIKKAIEFESNNPEF
jgi:tetratricopeptide (TPR) repeat protein